MAVIEFARNVLQIKNAGSTELNKRIYPVIGLINEWSKDGLIIKAVSYTHLTLPTILLV